jgi:hypothetical protein
MRLTITLVILSLAWLGARATVADEISDIIAQADVAEFQSYLRVLTGVDPVPTDPPYYLENRWSYGGDILIAADWIEQHFAAAGLITEQQVYDQTYGPNVIGELPGLRQPADIYIICGHYDTYHSGDQLHAPGCDDNGSGTATVMLAARLLSQYRFAATLRFVTFSGEEQWMVGSQAYCAAALAAGENILGAINLDMFLHPSFDNYEPDPDHDIDIGGDAASSWLAERVAADMSIYTPALEKEVHISSDFVSNQWAFWQFGYNAAGLIENTPQEVWGGSNDAYHQLTDVIDNPDYEWDFGLEVVRGALATLIDLGGLIGRVGDLNCDGLVNGYDIDPFVLALTDPAAYAEQWPDCDYMLGDVNGDGAVNGYDIDPFVGLLTGQ